jgi:hypothetical protein
MRALPVIAVLGAALVLGGLAACGQTDAGAAPDGGWSPAPDGGALQEDAGGPEGPIDQQNPNPTCHAQDFVPQRTADPDIMILMDVSVSMDDGTPSKYTQVAAAVTGAITALEQANSPIEWGLILFPKGSDCGIGTAPDVPIAVGNAQPIASIINGTIPGGSTPAHKAVDLAVQYYGGLDDARTHYLLIATDGQPNCESDALPVMCNPAKNDPVTGDHPLCKPGVETCVGAFGMGTCVPKDGSSMASKAIANALAAGIKTFVVGIDIDQGADLQLNIMAEAGGTARQGTTKYYPVSDQASLEDTLANITSQVISCTFALDALPDDPQYVTVTANGQTVPYDPSHDHGWDIDTGAKTLTIYGAPCTELQAHPDTIGVTYGCPPVQ